VKEQSSYWQQQIWKDCSRQWMAGFGSRWFCERVE